MVRRWWTRQDAAVARVRIARGVTGAAMMRSVWHLPPGDVFEREGAVLARVSRFQPGRMTARQYEVTRAVSLSALTLWTAGCDHWLVRGLANGTAFLLHRQNANLWPDVWNYSSHLHVFLALHSALGRHDRLDERTASTAVALMQLAYGSIYLHAGLAKVRASGWSWVDGRTLRGSWAECGTPLGRRLSRADPRLASAASLGALAFELGFLAATVAAGTGRSRAAVGLASVAFHTATKVTMNISFWHYSWYALPLFAPSAVVRALSGRARRRFRR